MSLDQETVSTQLKLLAQHRERLGLLMQQQAKFGVYTPPHILTDIREARNAIRVLKERLQAADVSVTDELDDELAELPKPGVRPACPYLGLRPFSPKEKDRFFGRQDEVRDLRNKLARHPLVFVIGPSGSGKSSLVQAGLIPALPESSQFEQQPWVIRTIRPGPSPLEELAHQLGGALDSLDLTLETLTCVGEERHHLLLVVDPFEEVFTLAPDVAPAFFQTITRISSRHHCYAVLVIRADFYGELMVPPYWAVVQQQRVELAPLRGEHLRSAIVEPARAVGVTIETALVERLMADAGDAPGALPLVQETLVYLWDEIVDMTIALEAYEELGLRAGSPLYRVLADCADASIAGLTEEEQRIAWRVLLRLVQFGEGRTNTRRQQPISALRSSDDDGTLLDRVLNHLAGDRLLTLGKNHMNEAVVDVSHEALLTRWPTLSARLDQDKAAELTRRNYDALAAQWLAQTQDGSPGHLLRDTELQEIEDWLAGNEARRVGYSAALVEWVAQSTAAATQDKQQRQAVLERLRVQERALRFSRVMLSVLLAGLVLAGLIFVGRLVYFEWLRQRADWEAEMVEIPSGPAVIGFATKNDVAEDIVSYYLDRYEVPNRHYRACVDADVCSEPLPQYGRERYRDPRFDNRPVVDITVFQAIQFCTWRGRRLPTVLEWERAVRGTEGRRAPWTTPPMPGTVAIAIDNYFPEDTVDVDALPTSATPQKEGAIFHLYGNVEEFAVQDGSETQYFVVGLSYLHGIKNDFTEATPIDADYGDRTWGFRCAADT